MHSHRHRHSSRARVAVREQAMPWMETASGLMLAAAAVLAALTF